MAGWLLAAILAPNGAADATAATPAAVRQEIVRLLDRLAASGCEFERNGRWHNASEARAHLLRKLELGEARQDIPGTEQFIQHAASTSSWSGRPYRVRCAGAAVQDSGPWLLGELARLRAGSGPASAPR